MTESDDNDHLRLLSIFHYVLSAILAVTALFPILHLMVGIAMVSGVLAEVEQENGPPLAMFGWFFVIVPIFMMTIGFTGALCVALAGRKIAGRRGYTYCLVVAGIECCFMPFGTALGIFTLMVLMRPSVKAQFGE